MDLSLPDEVFENVPVTQTELKEMLAVMLYQMKKINGVQGGKITNQSEIEFHDMLGKYGQYVQYDENDLIDDIDTIKTL